ncbi:aminoacyl tRNA synthase complex-interacting multifunctional protein 2-like [Uloborus diversus]|uniref:aminoacyl tRNA synthase complex-interacting multifunctional protein 2-like n=1 Tax=Uloborus diversus TaxID=327109 RepID=UPI00240A65F8|nr:aminoacyl tRNA synthase complex-interacting multifunctional protein 2-like [Uloborus diversus]
MYKNGPVKMYKVSPLYNILPEISLPTCMYKMENLLKEGPVAGSQNQEDQNLIELEKRQLSIIEKLEGLKEKVMQMKKELNVTTHQPLPKFQDVVIKANPDSPPLSLWILYQMLSQSMPVKLVTYLHSSLLHLPENVKNLQNVSNSESSQISLTVIWREGNKDHEMMIDPVHQGIIEGEVNIARYISRLLFLNYDEDPISATLIDDWLEVAHSSLIHGNNKDRQAALKSLNSHLGKNSFLVGNSLTVADIIIWSSLLQTKLHDGLPSNVSKWYKSLSENEMFHLCHTLCS